MGVGGGVVVCAFGSDAGEGVSGKAGVRKTIGHATYANVEAGKLIKTKFTQVDPRRGPRGKAAAGKEAVGAADG